MLTTEDRLAHVVMWIESVGFSQMNFYGEVVFFHSSRKMQICLRNNGHLFHCITYHKASPESRVFTPVSSKSVKLSDHTESDLLILLHKATSK